MKKLTTTLCILLVAGTVLAAQLPMLMVAPHFTSLDGLEYQFRGTGSDGQPIPDGPHVLDFAIFDDTGTAGTARWSESQTVITKDGLGSVRLGAVAPIPLHVFGTGSSDTSKALYLDITLDGESITPRTRLVPAPFAHVAERLLGDVVTGPANLTIVNPGGAGDTAGFLGVSSTKAETVHLYLTSNGEAVETSPAGMSLTDSGGDTAASYERDRLVLSNIGDTGEDGVAVELRVDRDSVGDLEARMSYFGLVEDGGRARTSKPREIVVVGSKVKEVVRFYENDLEDEVATHEYVSGRATGKRTYSPFRVSGAALPDTTPGYELRVDSGGTAMAFAKNSPDGTSTWLEVTSDTGGTSLAMNKADLIESIASASMSVDQDNSATNELQALNPTSDDTTRLLLRSSAARGEIKIMNIGSSGDDGVEATSENGRKTVRAHDFMAEFGDTGSVFDLTAAEDEASFLLSSSTRDTSGTIEATASSTGGELTLSNIGSSGLDGVSIAAGPGETEVKLGIEHEDIGASLRAADDGSGAALALFDLTTAGDTGKVELRGHELGHSLSIGNYGPSGHDGFGVAVDNGGAGMAFLDSVGDTAVIITTRQQTGGPTRGNKLFVGDLNWDGDYDLTLDGNLGVGVANPTNIIEVARNSALDPIADSWGTYSSRRWKENIRPLTDALIKVSRLRGVEYTWKEDGKHDIGLIAEEVGKVFPEIVAYEENGVDAKSVDYARLTAVLIEAVKEMKSENDQLRSDLAKAESTATERLSDLQAQVAELSRMVERLVDRQPAAPLAANEKAARP